MSEKFPVAIVGAGPAGLTASYFLSRHQIPHVVVEKSSFPKDKICGDALSGKVVDLLKKMDPSWVDEMEMDPRGFLGSYGVRFVAPNGKELDIPFKQALDDLPHAPGFLSKRMVFDDWLYNRVQSPYATFLQDTQVESVTRATDHITLHLNSSGFTTILHAELVIGAEGDRSVVAKHLGKKRKDNRHYCAGLRMYAKGVTGFHEKNFIELHFMKEVLPGYIWIFPLPNGEANIGVGMLSEVVSRKRINLKNLLEKTLREHPVLKERFRQATLIDQPRGWGLPLGSVKRSLSGDRYLLTGDAGSLIDPFTGEGIGNAMISGRLAAQTAVHAITQNRFDAVTMKTYDQEVYAQLWSELKLSHTLQRLTRYGWLFNFVVNKAAKNPLLQETITGMFENLDLRSRLRSPAFYFRLLFR